MATLIVPEGSTRTLTVLVREELGLSHSRARRVIEEGRVLVEGAPARDVASRPPGGSRVEILDRAPSGVPRIPTRALRGPGFRVIHLDEALIAVDKEPGVVVIPTSGPQDPDDLPLVARVGAALGLAGRKGVALWVVHRIDRQTSGLVLFARNERAYQVARDAFKRRLPLREYVAWTEGIPRGDEGELVHWLAESGDNHRMEVVREGTPGAQEARTLYRVEATTKRPHARARLRVRLVTGRRNQVRAQLAAIRCPLVGDRWFGARDTGPGRAALHAERLAFEHPTERGKLDLRAPWPEDLRRLDERLFGKNADS